MKFIELQGIIVNTESIKLIQKTVDKSKIKKKQNEDTGDVEEVIDGRPFETTFNLGDGCEMKLTYASRDERDQNFNLLLDVFEARREG